MEDARKCRYCGEFLDITMKRNGWLTAIKWLVPMVAIGYCVSLYDKDTLDEKSDLVSTNVESNEKEAIKIDEALETPIHIAFSQPDRICNILVDKGLDPNDPSTGGRWNYLDPIGYSCQAELEVTPGYYKFVGDVPNVIEFWVESKRQNVVDRFTITANVFNEKKEKPIMDSFTSLAKTLFSRLELALPDGLLNSIEARKPKTFEMDYGSININYEKYKIGHGLTLEVKRIKP
ncbi:MAG: hypothetical protein IPL46_08180 [Saprospiraceae bacterium]|nr:hypothetical protein [Saprospiraceae bacterium]